MRAYASAANASEPASPTGLLLRRLAPALAMLIAAFPVLIWPLLDAEPVSALSDFAPAQADGPPSLLNRIFFPTLFLLSLAANAFDVRRAAEAMRDPAVILTFVFLGWAAVTSLWSVEPGITQRRVVLQVMMATGAIGLVVAARAPGTVVRWLFWMLAVAALLNLAVVVKEPPGPLGHEGIYPHKNYLGAIAAMTVIVGSAVVLKGPPRDRLAALMVVPVALLLLVLAKAKTSLGLAIVVPPAALVTVILARDLRLSPAVTVPAALLGAIFVYKTGVAGGWWDFHAFAGTVFGDPTLTLRTDIWAFAMKKIAEAPWLGYGFEVFWGAGPESPSLREGPGFVAKMPHAHNGYLDLVLQTGAVGFVICMSIFLWMLHLAGRVARTSLPLAFLGLAVIWFLLLYNGLETTFFRGFNLKSIMMFVVIGLFVSHLAIEAERGRR